MHDLGVDVSSEQFVRAARDGVQIMGMSALLTTTMHAMTTTIQALVGAGVCENVKVMIRGAPVTQAYAGEIGADVWAPDASSAARKAKELLSLAD